MKEFIGKLSFETQEKLKLEFLSKNFGAEIIGWENPQTEISLELTLKKNDATAIQIEDCLDVKFDKELNSLHLKTNERDDVNKLRILIKTPKETSVTAESKNGGFKIKDLIGKQQFVLKNGYMKAENILGNIQAKSTNGALSIQNSEGDLKLELTNGASKIHKQEGEIKVFSQNGPIKIADSFGNHFAYNKNGNIKILRSKFREAEIENSNGGIFYVLGNQEKGKMKIKNKRGKVQLMIPEKIPYDLAAKNRLGRLYMGLDGEYQSSENDSVRSIQMTKGAGTLQIQIENELGSINLVKAHQHTENIELPDLGKILEKVPNLTAKKKIIEGLKKVQKKMNDLDLSNLIESRIGQEISQNIKEVVDDIDDNKQNANQLSKRIVKAVKEKIQDRALNKEEQETVGERSRIKILQMLKDGKITTEEAEKLLDALEN